MAADRPIRAILFACNMNSVRSPMAEALAANLLGSRVRVESCGVFAGYRDPFVEDVLAEIGLPKPQRDPQDFAEVASHDFDLVIALTGEAAAEARRAGVPVEFWDTENPTETRGTREDVLSAYRSVRDELSGKIKARFA